MIRRHIRRLAGHCNLDRRWSPGYEVCELPFPDPEQGLVDLPGMLEKLHIMGKRYTSVGSTSPCMMFRLEM